jgi:hypothetical protein
VSRSGRVGFGSVEVVDRVAEEFVVAHAGAVRDQFVGLFVAERLADTREDPDAGVGAAGEAGDWGESTVVEGTDERCGDVWLSDSAERAQREAEDGSGLGSQAVVAGDDQRVARALTEKRRLSGKKVRQLITGEQDARARPSNKKRQRRRKAERKAAAIERASIDARIAKTKQAVIAQRTGTRWPTICSGGCTRARSRSAKHTSWPVKGRWHRWLRLLDAKPSLRSASPTSKPSSGYSSPRRSARRLACSTSATPRSHASFTVSPASSKCRPTRADRKASSPSTSTRVSRRLKAAREHAAARGHDDLVREYDLKLERLGAT